MHVFFSNQGTGAEPRVDQGHFHACGGQRHRAIDEVDHGDQQLQGQHGSQCVREWLRPEASIGDQDLFGQVAFLAGQSRSAAMPGQSVSAPFSFCFHFVFCLCVRCMFRFCFVCFMSDVSCLCVNCSHSLLLQFIFALCKGCIIFDKYLMFAILILGNVNKRQPYNDDRNN